MVFEKHGGGHDQNGRIHEQRAVQRERRIEEIEAAGGALFGGSFANAPRLHQRRMQV